MKNECNVARDLMPLCIDGVASEDSQQFVDKHVVACHECELVYGEMKSALPQVTAEKENAALEKAAKAMHTKRTIRTLWAVIMGMTALMIALLANAGAVAEFIDDAWYQLRYVGPNNELRFDAYEVELEWNSHYYMSCRLVTRPEANRSFLPDFQLRYDELTGRPYLQIRALAVEAEPGYWGEELPFSRWERDGCNGYEYDFFSYSASGEMEYRVKNEDRGYWENVAITHIELVCGEDKLLLWQTGDGLPVAVRAGKREGGTEPIPTPTPRPTVQVYPYVPRSTSAPTAARPTATPTDVPKPTATYNKVIEMKKRQQMPTATPAPTPDATPAPTRPGRQQSPIVW